MSKNIVVSQSMYFPWIGLLEQIRLADCFVHYDDVQFTKGFYNRVQVKTQHGVQWITVPLKKHHRGQNIDEVLIDNSTNWKKAHREILRQAYLKAPYLNDMMGIIDKVYEIDAVYLSDISRSSVLELASYFDLDKNAEFLCSKILNIDGKSSQRLHDIVKCLNGTKYITGHGAYNYLDHELFEKSGVSVEYMNYEMTPYTQLYGTFTPYVSALDVVANMGKGGLSMIKSGSLRWENFTMKEKL